MNIDTMKRVLQDFFTSGVVTIVGSGLSCAEGLPGMPQLATTLLKEVPENLTSGDHQLWNKIKHELENGNGLEETLLKHPPTETLESSIINITTRYIKQKEIDVINKTISGERVLRFSKFVKQLAIPKNGLSIITTNYDRLIEIACEINGLPIDNMFFGNVISRLDEQQSRMSFCRDISKARNKNFKLRYHRRIKIFKPHGCLSWYVNNGEPINSTLNLELKNLIITPGLNKFRTGYQQPFDIHRERANNAIDNASCFIIIGYGFNDDHLETHLVSQIEKGIPALIITRGLTQNTERLIKSNNNVVSLSYYEKRDKSEVGTLFRYNEGYFHFKNLHIWDLNNFVLEVLDYEPSV